MKLLDKIKAWWKALCRWWGCSCTEDKSSTIVNTTTEIYPFPERSSPTNLVRRDSTIRRSSTTHESTTKRPITYAKSVAQDDDRTYRKVALDDEETIPIWINTDYPSTEDSHSISGGDDSHVDFGGGSGDGGGASGSWGESHNE